MLNPQAGICPQCQHSNSPEAQSCSRCGMPLTASGAPAGFNTPFGTLTPSADPEAQGAQPAAFGREADAAAQPGVPPAFGAPATPSPASPGEHGLAGEVPPAAFGPNGAMPPGVPGASWPGHAGEHAQTPPGAMPPGMVAPGAHAMPPAHYGAMSAPGVPPGMEPNPGYSHPGLPQQHWHPQTPPPAMKNNRVTLGILAILLGSLGIHKFMLGQTTAGIITLVLSVFTCGMVSSVIGLIEGIIYLTKSDAEFYQIYEVERKAWF